MALGLALALAQPASAEEAPPETHILAIGTSLTARAQWPEDLRLALAACLPGPVKLTRLAQPGANSNWGVEVLDQAVAARAGIVLVEFATNDAALHRGVTLHRSMSNLARMLVRVGETQPPAQIVVMGMGPAFGLSRLARPRLEAFVAAHARAARENGAEFIDFSGDWSRLDPAPARFFPDGLHPDPQRASAVMVPRLVAYLAGTLAPRCAQPVHR